METGSIMAGQCAALVKEEMTVKEIIADLINDYTNVLNKVLKND
jgi:NAD(P)H-dependent flavin oxidoreductase YrpB (nitropropane dioxygenase family)